MTDEADRDPPLPNASFRIVNPGNIDTYHEAATRELDALHAVNH